MYRARRHGQGIGHSEKHRSPTRNTPQPRAFRGTAAKEFPILLASAARAALASVPRLGGDGGLVAVDRRGNIAMPFNSQGMYRACIDRRGRRTIVIYR